MNYYCIDKVDDVLLKKAAALHHEHLSYRSFITSFGAEFLTEIYRDLLNNNLGFFVFAGEGEQIQGFVMGCVDTAKFFKLIRTNFIKYGYMMFFQLLRNPFLLKKLFETFFYTEKEQCPVNAELIVIVVESNLRSSGIGSELVKRMESVFLEKYDLDQYKVTVHEEMSKSNNFYVKNGCKLYHKFTMYGVLWNLYTKKIGGI